MEDDYLANELIKEATITQTENGNIKMELHAMKFERISEPNSLIRISEGVEVRFYNEESLLLSTLNSEEAEINEQEQIMIAKVDVILESEDGKKIQCQELIWDEREDMIFTEKKVTITTEGQIIQGEGFTSNPNFSSYQLNKTYGVMSINSSK